MHSYSFFNDGHVPVNKSKSKINTTNRFFQDLDISVSLEKKPIQKYDEIFEYFFFICANIDFVLYS